VSVASGATGTRRRRDTPRSTAWRRRRQTLVLALFMVPALALLTVFVIVPSVWAIYISLTDQALTGASALSPHFVGFDNYRRLFADSDFYHSLWISLEFIFLSSIVGQFVFGLVAALLINRPQTRAKAMFSGSMLLPLAVPETVAAYLWASMLAPGALGTVNRLTESAGFGHYNWLQDFPLSAIIVVNIWRGIAFAMIIFMAALEQVPREVVEAASVDGANARQRLFHITLPMIRYSILLYMLLTTVTTFGVFGLVFVLTQGGPNQATELLTIYMYHKSFGGSFELGYGSAVGVVTLFVSLLFGLFYVRVLRSKV
jgi:multiple sugar transport system permease protein